MLDNREYYTARYSDLRLDGLVKRASNLTLEEAIQKYTSWYVLFVNGFADRLRGKSVLELGSGDGLNALLMARFGAKVTAIEIAEPAVRVLRDASEILHLDVQALHGDFLKLDLSKFDYIVGKGFLHHLDHELEARYLSKIARLLNPGGEARFAEPAVNSQLLDSVRWLIPVPNRPSILNRARFKQWKEADPHPDRDNSSAHYTKVGRLYFENVNVAVFGGLERFRRFIVDKERSQAYAEWALEAERRYLPRTVHRVIARGQAIMYSKPLPQ